MTLPVGAVDVEQFAAPGRYGFSFAFGRGFGENDRRRPGGLTVSRRVGTLTSDRPIGEGRGESRFVLWSSGARRNREGWHDGPRAGCAHLVLARAGRGPPHLEHGG